MNTYRVILTIETEAPVTAVIDQFSSMLEASHEINSSTGDVWEANIQKVEVQQVSP